MTPSPAISRRFGAHSLGLAAVAEERGDWDAAKRNYEAVVNDSNVPTALKDYAKQREDMLADLRKKPFLGTAAVSPSPSTRPLVFGPETPQTAPAPTTAPVPATVPSIAPLPLPTTQPATSPSTQPTTAPTTTHGS